jgi:hypothetical protein
MIGDLMRQGVAHVTTKKEPKEVFLEVLAKTGIVGEAAKAAGFNRRTAYRYRLEDPEFASDWDDAVEQAVDMLEKEAWRRASQGVLKPIFQGGDQVGEVREYSDTLLIFLLKGNRPRKFHRPTDVNLNVQDIDAKIDQELQRGRELAGLGTGEEACLPASAPAEE